MRTLAWGATERGPVRSVNEDALVIDTWPDGGLFIAADGMGAGGDVPGAVRDALEAFRAHYRAEPYARSLLEATLHGAVRAAQASLAAADNRMRAHSVGCALSVLVVTGEVARLAWVGDCRVWRLRRRLLEQLTVDHSLVEMLVAEGKLNAAEARTSPHQNILTRTLSGRGEGPDVVESTLMSVSAGDRFLLASDGVWRALDLMALQSRLAVRPVDLPGAAEAIVTAAMGADGKDNGVAVVVFASDQK